MSATAWLIIAIVGFSLSGIALVATIFIFIKLNIPAVIGDLSGKTVAREIKAMRDANASGGNKIHKSSTVNSNRSKLTEKVSEEYENSYASKAHSSKRLDAPQVQQPAVGVSDITAQPGMQFSAERGTEYLSSNAAEVDINSRRSTEILKTDRATDILVEDRKTDILDDRQGTAILTEGPATELLPDSNGGTDILTEAPGTAILTESVEFEEPVQTQHTQLLDDDYTALAASGGTSVLDDSAELAQEVVFPVTFRVTRSVVKIHTDEVIC